MPVRILLVSNQMITREGLRALLERQADMVVVAEVEEGLAALQIVREASPDVVIIDSRQCDSNLMEVVREIVGEMPGVEIVVLNMCSDRQSVKDMFRAGVAGYVSKDCGLSELVLAVRTVTSRQKYLCPKMHESVLGGFLDHISARGFGFSPALTPKEREVVRCLVEGKKHRGDLLLPPNESQDR